MDAIDVQGPADPAPEELRSSAMAWLLPLGALAVVAIVLRAVAPDGLAAELTFVAVTVGAGVLAAAALRRARSDRWAWGLVAAGVSASAIADLVYFGTTHVRGVEPDVSAADGFWFASYLLIGAGVVALELRAKAARQLADLILDVAAVGVVGLLVVWQVSVDSTLSDASLSTEVRLVWAAYPILDAILLALVVHAVIDPGSRSLAQRLLAGGALCWLVSDLLYLTDAAESAPWVLDAGWMVGALLLAAAVATRRRTSSAASSVSSDDDGRVALRLAVIGLSPLLVPGLFELWGHWRGVDVDPVALFAATAVLIVLAFVRAHRLIRVDRSLRSRLRSSEHHYRALAANSSDAVVIIDEHGRLMNDAPNLRALLGGWDPSSEHDPFAWVATEDAEEIRRSFENVLVSPGSVVPGEVRYVRPDGTTVWLASRAVNLLHDPDVGGIVVNLHDITARKQLEDDLAHQAFHDSLTGLANRALLSDRLDQAFKRRSREESAAVIYLDLDGFKHVNDSLGHDAGDRVLREVAGRLAASVREGDTVGRLGGDEFAVITQESKRCLDEAQTIAERIIQVLTPPIVLDGASVVVSASVGIATTARAASAAEAMSDADNAMYQAKAKGRGRIVVHEPSMRGAASERLRLEADLAGALDRRELVLHYQPVVDLADEHLVGFEALVRWRHPDLGLIPPDDFVPLAEDNGSIGDIGAWVLREACATTVRWRTEHLEAADLTIAVNVSGRQLAGRRLLDDVRIALDETGLPADRLVLEMTETALIEDPERTAALLQELSELGVRLAIDDFGTGYSSLSYLRQFPVDILKIDRSFIATITEDRRVPAIVHGLIDLGRTLGLEIIAEGIEERSQQAGLRAESCMLGQGFLFARPVEVHAASQLIAEQDRGAELPAVP
jgi:diguanylate cyclase (GGDEF)-like protein/PAS domain S-box-containing protein